MRIFFQHKQQKLYRIKHLSTEDSSMRAHHNSSNLSGDCRVHTLSMMWIVFGFSL